MAFFRKGTALFLCFLVLYFAFPAIGLTNPMTEYDTLDRLLAACKGVAMSDAPEGAEQVTYTRIEGNPVVAQIEFVYLNSSYTYRAAAMTGGAIPDISGVYEQFQNTATRDAVTAGGTFTLWDNDTDGTGLAQWADMDARCLYTLYTKTGCGDEQLMIDVVDALYAGDSQIPQTVSGTVTALRKSLVTIALASGTKLSFITTTGTTIIGTKKMTVGDSVRITYVGDAQKTPPAMQITIGSIQPEPDSGKSLTGEVVALRTRGLTVYTDRGNTYLFSIDRHTGITGQYVLQVGARVRVTYEGLASQSPAATTITVLSDPAPAPTPTPRPEPSLYTVSGTIQSRYGDGMRLFGQGAGQYDFRTVDAYQTGDLDAGEGDYATVTYYVMENGTLDATYIILEDSSGPAPTAEPELYTASGNIISYDDDSLTIVTYDQSAYTFNLSGARITGDSDAQIGDEATVTYYYGANDVYAKLVVLTVIDPWDNPLYIETVETEEPSDPVVVPVETEETEDWEDYVGWMDIDDSEPIGDNAQEE